MENSCISSRIHEKENRGRANAFTSLREFYRLTTLFVDVFANWGPFRITRGDERTRHNRNTQRRSKTREIKHFHWYLRSPSKYQYLWYWSESSWNRTKLRTNELERSRRLHVVSSCGSAHGKAARGEPTPSYLASW